MGLLCSCSDADLGFDPGRVAENCIRIGGLDTDGMTVSSTTTRAASYNAETIEWLQQPLKNGLDITYGLSVADAGGNHEDVAILKLIDTNIDNGKPYDTDENSDLAVYSFKYRADRKDQVGKGNDAIWYNNGFHYFQGVHVPMRIRYTTDLSELATERTIENEKVAPVTNLTTDQHDGTATGGDNALGNYTLLAHYLGMPANFRLTATVERIKLPFRHRLARVVAFVLIDPELNTTLKGYRSKDSEGHLVGEEDPNTTSIRFCNVKVLEGVKDEKEPGGHHKLTPTWTQARKIIPHFDGERGSYSYKTQQELDEDFKYYYKDNDGKMEGLFPTSANWKSVHDATPVDGLHNGYTEVNYGKVPVYDVIVRPTYTTVDSLMYDEKYNGMDFTALTQSEKQTLANETNKIDFELELANGLRYEKRFEFDLNANYQTVVYLRISREHVDYNDAGSDLWIEEKSYDGWYGVDNLNGNTLSFAGSSWQRAYTYGVQVDENYTTPNHQEGVTDGHFYNATSSDDEREKAQYYTAAYKDIWVQKFLQAYQGGAHHGDYFVLGSDIEIDASIIPDDFVFTGHLDGQDHTITLTGTNSWVQYDDKVLAKLKQKTGNAGNDDDYTDVPRLYWMKEIAQAPPHTRGTIPAGDPFEINLNTTTPADLTTKDSEGKVILYKVGDEYQVYTNRVFYQNTGASLFDGLNGIYTTAQEANPGIKDWEANVHRETNGFGSGTHWVPTTGYRAEVLNVKMAAGTTLFAPGATITGNVQNCYNGSTAIDNNTPAIPIYK